MIKRWAELSPKSDTINFIMQIPTKGVLAHEDLYQKMLRPESSNYNCLVNMAEMVKLIEDEECGKQ